MHFRLRQSERKANVPELLGKSFRLGSRAFPHQELPPERNWHTTLTLCMNIHRLASRIRFAVSWNLPCSTAMLITRKDGMVSYAFGRCSFSKTEAPHRSFCAWTLIRP